MLIIIIFQDYVLNECISYMIKSNQIDKFHKKNIGEIPYFSSFQKKEKFFSTINIDLPKQILYQFFPWLNHHTMIIDWIFSFSQLTGVFILGLSAYLWWDSQNYLDIHEVSAHYVTPFIAMLILGGMITIIGFLGCCGAIRESKCLLLMVCLNQLIYE